MGRVAQDCMGHCVTTPWGSPCHPYVPLVGAELYCSLVRGGQFSFGTHTWICSVSGKLSQKGLYMMSWGLLR